MIKVEKRPEETIIRFDEKISEESLNDIMRYIKIKSLGSKSVLTDEEAETEAGILAKKTNQKWLSENREKYNLW